MNNVTLSGRLTKDPEMTTLQSGIKLAKFTIAVDRDFGKETDFFNVEVWRQSAEFVEKYITKGHLVAITGAIQNDNWTDKEGNKRTTTKVVAQRVESLQSLKVEEQAPKATTNPALEQIAVDAKPVAKIPADTQWDLDL